MGADNFFLFGLNADQVLDRQRQGADSQPFVDADAELQEALQMITEGYFSPSDRGLFRPLFDSMPRYDPYMVLADFRAYVDCQDRVARTWAEPRQWQSMSILNTARMGPFSSDRAVLEYCRDIWHVQPVPITAKD
ncbi:MAG: starch phosphorylase [Rhodothermales bacterium]